MPFTGPGYLPPPPFQDLQLGPLNLRMYGLCIALGVLAAVWIGQRRWAHRGGDPEDITTIALVAVPAGLLGARLYHVITDWSDKYSDGRWWPDAFMIWKGGLGIPGGVLLGTLAGVMMARRQRVDWRLAADAVAPALPVAQAIGRLGNWFNQELFGRPTDLPWALRVDPIHRPVGDERFATYHPTFAYEALWNLGLAALIVGLGRRWVLRPGRWFAVYVMGYGLGRLWVEALRADDATRLLGLRVNIWTSLVAIVGGGIWLFWGGNPVDREATERLRGGEPLADILAMPPSRAQEAVAALAEAQAEEAERERSKVPVGWSPTGSRRPPGDDEDGEASAVDADPETETETETETEPDPETETEPDPETETEPDPEPASDLDPDSNSEPGSRSGASDTPSSEELDAEIDADADAEADQLE